MASNRKSQNRLTTNPGESESDEKRHAHGAIARIKLENFMTYKEVELFPGPRLNVIIGPNGSGKSSIVCAICLGLAGSTKIIGRAHNVCEYIKTGCEKAIIEIELFNQEDGCNWIINRTINTNNSSIWTLNGKKSTEGDIKNQVRKLHIQVDNLCQFLPQEKVADFTRMSKDDMLENTEKCVGGETLFQLHKSLKDLGEKARNYEQELNELESEISTSKQAIKHMEPDMQSFQGRKELETKIMHYTQYKGYLEYEEKALEHQRVAQAWEEMKKRINEVKQRLKPVTDIMNDRKKDMEKSQTLFRTKLKQTLELKTRLTNAINAFTEDKDDLIEKIREDLRHKREEERRRIEQCEDITNQISVLTEQLEITDQNANDHNDLEVEWNELEKNRKQLDQQNHSLQVKGQRITDDLRKLQLQLTSKQRELEQINNVQNIRLQKLQSFNPDAFKAVQWYRKNKHLFKKVVYEPMILSLNIEDQNMTKYVEFIIPKRDLTAMFIFEDTDDMELFISECHTKQHLVVHASAIPRMTLQAYKNEAKPISTYQHYGMRKYVLDVIDGPDPVLRYLCQTTKIHMIPIADDSALKTIDTLINDQTLNIRRFFVKNFCYTISTSFYSRQTSTTNVQVQNARFLTDSINQQRKQQLENDYQNLKQDHAKLTTDYRASQDEILELAKELDGIKQQKLAINEKRNARTKLERKIAEKKQALALYQNKKIDLAKEEKSSREKEKKIHEDKLNKLNDHANYLNDYNQRCAELTIESCRLAISRYEHEKAKADLETHNEDLTKIKEESVQKQNQMKASETETRICAQNVIKSIGKTLPTNVSLLSNEIIMEVKSKFVGLPQTIQDLDTDIMSFTAQLNCQSNVKEDIIREYRNQTKKLADLEGRRQGLELRINQHQSTADNSKDNWLKQVKEMISQINEKFVDLFNTMGCKGEICLDVPENGDDYEKYGINIKVQFRDGEKLHEMSEFLQSGGEKSVSVMLYMIALQNMTICPFRCVDEINQGMDPQNERRVFELLVRHSSDKANSQYFLLSPKLLPDLKYSKKIKLLFVCNGEVALKSHEWNVAKYIERRKALQSL